MKTLKYSRQRESIKACLTILRQTPYTPASVKNFPTSAWEQSIVT